MNLIILLVHSPDERYAPPTVVCITPPLVYKAPPGNQNKSVVLKKLPSKKKNWKTPSSDPSVQHCHERRTCRTSDSMMCLISTLSLRKNAGESRASNDPVLCATRLHQYSRYCEYDTVSTLIRFIHSECTSPKTRQPRAVSTHDTMCTVYSCTIHKFRIY